MTEQEIGFRSGFVALIGRPNSGKSTLLNQICGEKVAITSNKVQTTRYPVKGVFHDDDVQIVFVDTPGIHKPVTALGSKLNEAAESAIKDVDITCLVIDALAPFGRGDQFVADKLGPSRSSVSPIVIINKIDRASREQVVKQLQATSELDFAEYFPLSARTGEGVGAFVSYLADHMPAGPRYYPPDMISDLDEPTRVAELVREQLFRALRQELPYSIATRITEWEWPYVRCEIVVERESQKGMVIGNRGEVLKKVGIAVREQLPKGTYLELQVSVDKDWQNKPERIEHFGY